MTIPLVIFGTEDVAQVVACYFESGSCYRVAAFTVDANYLKTETLLGHPVVPWALMPERYPPDQCHLFIAISYGNFNKNRMLLIDRAQKAGYQLASYISNMATITAAEIGDNVLITESVSVQPFSRIACGTFLWPHTVIAHHAVVEACSYIGPHAFVGGNSIIGKGCIIGPHATVASLRHIGQHCFIGAGARIFNNLGDGSLVLERGSRAAHYTAATAPKVITDKLFNL